MPKKYEATGLLENQIEYTKELLDLLTDDGRFEKLLNIKEQMNCLKETMEDTEIELEYSKNKDARIYVCKAGHMAITKRKTGNKDKNQQVKSYFFDVEKCKHCPFKDGCYKEESKAKTFNVKIKDETHIEHIDYIETNEFKELYSNRYMI